MSRLGSQAKRTQLGVWVCDRHARMTGTHMRQRSACVQQRHLAPCRDKTFMLRQGLGLGFGEQGLKRGFHVATESLWPCVETVDRVAIECG